MESRGKKWIRILKKIWIPDTFIKQRIFMICLVVGICLLFIPANIGKSEIFNVTPHEQVNVQNVLREGDVVEQHILLESELLPSALSIGFSQDTEPAASSDDSEPTKYRAQLFDTGGAMIAQAEFAGANLQNGTFLLPLPAEMDMREQDLLLRITALSVQEDQMLWLVTEPASDSGASLTLNGETLTDTQLSLGVMCRHASTPICITALLIMIASVACIMLWRSNIANNTLLVLLVFGLLFCFMTPIFDVPDEPVHTAKSMMMGNGDFFRSAPQGNLISQSWNRLHEDFQKTLADTSLYHQEFSQELFYMQDGISQLFLGYLPQALAFALSNLWGLAVLPTFYLGRIFNLLFYAILAWLAVKYVKKFKLFFAAVSMMPMCLYISASYNPEAYIYGLCLVMAAYFVNLCFDRSRKIGWKQVLILALLVLLISIKKYNFAPFLLLPLCIPAERFASKKIKYLGSLLTFAVVTVGVLAVFYAIVQMEAGTAAGDGNSLVGEGTNVLGANMGQQIAFILQNKLSVAKMVLQTVTDTLGGYLMGMFTFGWLSYTVPSIVSIAWFVFIGLTAFFYARSEYERPNILNQTRIVMGSRIGILLTMGFIVLASYLMMYLGWTTVGAMTILGVQGRYFIPALFFLPMIGQNIFPLVSKDAYKRAEFNIIFVAMLFLVATLLTTAAQYY